MTRPLITAVACAGYFAVSCFGFACGEVIEEPPSGVGGSAGSAGSGGGGGTGAAASGSGGSGASGAAGSATTEPDAGAGGGMGGSGGSGGFQYPSGCPVPNPIAATPTQRVALQSFNFITSEVVLKNISSTTQIIAGDRLGWQWCSFPSYWNIAPQGDVTLSPGETYKFELINNTQGVWPLPVEGSELAIYIESGTFDEPDKMVSFVSWGDGLASAGREYVATLAELWTLGQRVELNAGDSGFVAIGPSNEASGYDGVPLRCLVAPPNEDAVEEP